MTNERRGAPLYRQRWSGVPTFLLLVYLLSAAVYELYYETWLSIYLSRSRDLVYALYNTIVPLGLMFFGFLL